MRKAMALFGLAGILIFSDPATAQLNQVFDGIFKEVLRDKLQLSAGAHGTHFFDAADLASSSLTPALTSLIASNVASFPLSSTVAGVTFDFSSGRPVAITESLGPIFAETATTVGREKINLGFNFTNLSLSKFRGLATKDIRFTFIHENIDGLGAVGDDLTERDFMDLFLGLDVNARIFAFSATYGITANFDIGVAVPVVNVSLNAKAGATINSYTFATLRNALHRFNDNGQNPQLDYSVPEKNESATGIGDLGLRLKYNFAQGTDVDLAALLDIRLPTGSQDDFLGTGKTNIRLCWIASKKIGNFAPHFNLAYDRRSAELDSDEFELVAGFDQKITSGVTFAADILAELDLNKDEAIELFPGVATISGLGQVDLSNIPARHRDNVLNAAVGFRAAPSERFSLLGNVIISLNDGGLRSSVIPTIGANLSF